MNRPSEVGPAALHALAVSATVEQALAGVTGAVVVALLLRAALARSRTRGPIALAPWAERVAMAVLLVWVVLTRLVGAGWAQQPRFYFSQVGTLYYGEALRSSGFLAKWLKLLANLQVIWEHDSPIQAPVAMLFQAVLGPSLELPTTIGAAWAVVAVVLAWRLGRAAESPAFGVLFAALVATSPLQTTWARLGGIYVGASAGVLGATYAGWIVGRRRGVLAAAAVGVVAWCCVYFYYPARVGMGLAFVGLWSGWRRSDRGVGRLAALVAAAAIGCAACFLVHQALAPGQSLWPAYRTYLGSPGETSVGAWIGSLVDVVRRQLPIALDGYFWSGRAVAVARALPAAAAAWPGSVLSPGMAAGGLVLLPVLVLGILGALRALRHPQRHGVWLAFAVTGFLPPLLGFPSARRFLAFDVGWCALAALGLLGVLESRLLAPATSRARGRLATAFVGALAVWSVAATTLLDAALPPQHVHMPFGESGFGDGATCLGCLDTARRWQEEMGQGRMVIALDADMYRENATSPGGIMLYGKTAALAVGRPELFVDYYAVAANVDWVPPRPGPLAASVPLDLAAALAARIEAARPTAVVWWFTEPNVWERALAEALGRAGSHVDHPPMRAMWSADRTGVPVSAIRVETPWERRADALAALRAVVDPPAPPPCVALERIATRAYGKWPLGLAPLADGDSQAPEWAVVSWGTAEVWGREQPGAEVVGFDYPHARDGDRTVEALDVWGVAHTWSTGDRTRRLPTALPRPLGRYCAAFVGDGWWVVDPLQGTLWPPNAAEPMALDAIGVVAAGDRLVVATADQRLHALDPATGRILRTTPATVAPARRFNLGECAMLAAGDGWIASVDSLRGLVSVYDEAGAPLGRLPLAAAAGTTGTAVHAVRGAGRYLGVGHDTTITTFRVTPDPACDTAR